jgi:hypothetical protein
MLLDATQRNSLVGVCCTNSATTISLEATQSSRQLCVGDVKHNFVHLKSYRGRERGGEAESLQLYPCKPTHIHIHTPLYTVYTYGSKLPSPLPRTSSKTHATFFYLGDFWGDGKNGGAMRVLCSSFLAKFCCSWFVAVWKDIQWNGRGKYKAKQVRLTEFWVLECKRPLMIS